MLQTFNFLIIGRCGSGKSATTRQLTGSEAVEVRNSPHSVTQNVRYYQSTPAKIERCKVSFGVLDIPGLDEIGSRKRIRDIILHEMQERQIDFDAILYTVDCVTRDVVDNRKIFNFLNELPWTLRDTKECLIPILTKYDNLVFDAEDENTKRTLEEFGRIFEQNNYGESWRQNGLYWINTTKNVERKMSICNEIKEVYETQLERLIGLLVRKKTKLTRNKIRQFLDDQHKYIQRKAKQLIRNNQLVMRAASCMLGQQLTIQLSRQKHTQNYTAATLGGLGVLLTKIVKSDLGKAVLVVGSVLITSCFIFRNLAQESTLILERQQERPELKMKFQDTYVVEKIYEGISNSLRDFMTQVQCTVNNNWLVVHIPERFEGDYFTIHNLAVTECYLDDSRLDRDERGDFRYAFLEEQERTVTSQLKLRFTLMVPEEHQLLERFEQQSYNFKKQLDLI